MPMFGVIRLTFEREGGSMRGDEDFFSVARTMPFVAFERSEVNSAASKAKYMLTLNTQCSDTLVDSVQGIFWASMLAS